MSNDVQALVWRSDFPTPAAKLVALKLADNANDDGENVWPSISTVETRTGLSRSAVCEWLRIYDKVRLVEKVGVVGGKKGTTLRRFGMDVLSGLADTRRRDGSGSAPRLQWVADGSEWKIAPIEGDVDNPAVAQNSSKGSAPLGLVQQVDQSSRRTRLVRLPDSASPPSGPKPSLNHPSTSHTPADGRRARRVGVEKEFCSGDAVLGCLDQLIAERPDRERVVRLLLSKIVRCREFRAKDPAFALGDLADWIAEQEIDDAALGEIAEALFRTRSIFDHSSVQKGIRAHIAAREAAQRAPAPPAGQPTVPRALEPPREQVAKRRVDAGSPEFDAAVDLLMRGSPKLARNAQQRGYTYVPDAAS